MLSATTLNDVIFFMSKDRRYKQILKSMLFKANRSYLMDDVYQDLIIVTMEQKDVSEVIRMFNDDKLIYWWSRLCSNNIFSSSSRIYYNYIKNAGPEEESIPDAPELTRDIAELIDFDDNLKRLNDFLNKTEQISRQHKIGVVCFRHFYLDQMTYQEIESKYKQGNLSMSYYKIYTSVKFIEEYIKQNFEWQL